MSDQRRDLAMDPHGKLWSLLYSTVLLEVHISSVPKDDSKPPDGSATGFLFFKQVEGSRGCYYLVTNRHVVQGAKAIVFSMTAKSDGRPVVGRPVRCIIENAEAKFVTHPDPTVDVAVFDASLQFSDDAFRGGVYYQSVFSGDCPNEDELREHFDAIEDVAIVGYPRGIYDSHNLQPVVRKGSTATPMWLDYEKKPTFLIDAPIFPGSSGSPVFLYDRGLVITGGAEVRYCRCHFVGIVACYKYFIESVAASGGASDALSLLVSRKENLNLGVVFRTRTILKAIAAHEAKARGESP